MNNEFCVLWKPYPSKIWQRIDSYLTGNTKPQLSNNEISKQCTFSLSFNDKSFTDQLNFKTGDDICITTNSNYTDILDKKYCGKIHKREIKINAFSTKDENNNRKKLRTQTLTIQQRDFSLLPIEVNYEDVTSIETIINSVFQEYTKNSLGGILNNTLFPKIIFLNTAPDIPNFKFFGTAMQILKELCARTLQDFAIDNYCEPNSTNLINTMDQVRIWAQ